MHEGGIRHSSQNEASGLWNKAFSNYELARSHKIVQITATVSSKCQFKKTAGTKW